MDHEGIVLDVDGTVVRGDEPIDGAPEGYRIASEAGLEPLFVSNNPTKPPAAYVDRLGSAGFAVDADRVITAGAVTVEYLKRHHADDELFVIGESGLFELLSSAGLSTTESIEDAEVLLASLDRKFDYEDLSRALWVLEDGIPFLGTDPDVVIPARERDVPGSGAVINAIAGVAEREPDLVCGKPSDPAIDLVTRRIGVAPEDCLVVGDRLDTDVALGERAGMTTALVTTGVTDEADVADSPYDPDYVLDSLADLDRIL